MNSIAFNKKVGCVSEGMYKKENVFDKDAIKNDGYYYTNTDKLSCWMANKRLSDAVQEMANLKDKKVIDVGCGDGTYTMELLACEPAYLLGVDAAEGAIKCASKKAAQSDKVMFRVGDIYHLEAIGERFDVAVVRGVLHHLDNAEKAIRSVMKIADEIIVIETNGYNPVLKIIEKTSRYHIEHEEKSYFPYKLDRWFTAAGGRVELSCYCGLVPFFCPDWLAKILKNLEPTVESVPFLRQLGCAVYVQKVVVNRSIEEEH